MSEPGAGIDRRDYLRLVALGPLIGIPAALLAAGFLGLVHELEHLLWDDLPDALGHSSPPAYLVIGLPVVGAGFVAAARALLPGAAALRRSRGSASTQPRRPPPSESPWRRSARCPSGPCSGQRRR